MSRSRKTHSSTSRKLLSVDACDASTAETQVVDPEVLDQDEQRDLVDEDPEDADERELRGMEQ